MIRGWGRDDEARTWEIPWADIEAILADRAEWRAWALALEHAGRWAR